MAKKTRQELEYESWRRRLQSALIDLETAASLWSGCVSEAELSGMSEPQYQFIAAMDDVLTGTQDVVSESISLRIWDLAQDMQKAIEDGEEGLKELRESVDGD